MGPSNADAQCTSPCPMLRQPQPCNQHPNPEYRMPHTGHPSGKNSRRTSLHYLPAPSTLQTLRPLPKTLSPRSPYSKSYPLIPKCTLHTPPRKQTRKPFPPARTPHLFHALPLETDACSLRSTYPAGSRSPWPGPATQDPVAVWFRVRSAILLAHYPNFRSLLHWGSPGEPDPPLKRSVTHGEGRGRH